MRWIACIPITLAIALGLPGCRTHKIDTWEEWCAQIEGRTPQGAIVSFDESAIRADFTSRLNAMLVSGVAKKYLNGASPNDSSVQELVRLRMVGAWSEGTTLHIANSLMHVEPTLGIDEWSTTRREWERLLDPSTPRDSLSSEQHCIEGVINGVFDHVVLHGPSGVTSTLAAQHTLKH